MKWMLVVVVLGSAPVKTGLLFDDLDSCWTAREPIAQEYADVFNNRAQWVGEHVPSEQRAATVEFLKSSLLGNRITCIPHADDPQDGTP
jgi:hypothetical protein